MDTLNEQVEESKKEKNIFSQTLKEKEAEIIKIQEELAKYSTRIADKDQLLNGNEDELKKLREDSNICQQLKEILHQKNQELIQMQAEKEKLFAVILIVTIQDNKILANQPRKIDYGDQKIDPNADNSILSLMSNANIQLKNKLLSNLLFIVLASENENYQLLKTIEKMKE